LEHEVLAVLLSVEDAMTAAQVRAAMGGTLAYTTVMTVLSRIAEKGLALKQRRGRAHVYSPVRDGAQVTALRMRRLLDAADDDRALVLARFVGSLSDEDEAMLMQMLANPGRDQ
jgi:predicted transcriptional regulator